MNDDNEEPITNEERTIDEEGREVWRFNKGKMKVTVRFLNQPSEEAIRNCNQTYNELFDKFN
jgi:hypothetical protein